MLRRRTAPAPADAPPAPSLDDRKDAEILAALEVRDYRQALALLMKAYGSRVYAVCRAVLRDPTQAEDVHQTVFVDAYKALRSFEKRSSISTWLIGIAHNRCLHAARTQRRFARRFVFASAEGYPPNDAASSVPEETLLRVGDVADLELCLKELRPEVRIAVLLRFAEEMPYAEMARVTRERQSTLQMRVARALTVLRRCLERREVHL